MTEHALWTGLQGRMDHLQQVLDNIGQGHRKADDVAAPLYEVKENYGEWHIGMPQGAPMAMFNPKLRAALMSADPVYANSVSRNDLLSDNPNSHFLLGINFAPILTFGDVSHTILVRRDATAPNNPNRLNFLGGVSTEDPALTGIKELNEEAAIFILDGDKLHRARFNFEGRDGIDEETWKASFPIVRKRLPTELQSLDIQERRVNLTIEETSSPPLQTVRVLGNDGSEASRVRGILSPLVKLSDFSMIIPVKPDWAGAGLNVHNPRQILCIDTETFVPEGRKIGLFPIAEISQIPDDEKMPHVALAGRVWARGWRDEPGGAS